MAYFIVQTIRRKWFSEDYILQGFSQLGAGILLINLIYDFCWNCVSPGLHSAWWMEKDLHSYHSMDLTVSIAVMQIPGFRFSQPSCIPNFSPPISKQEVTLFHMQIAACLNRGLLSEVLFFFFFHGGQWCKIWGPFHMALGNFFLSSLRMMHNVWIWPTTEA